MSSYKSFNYLPSASICYSASFGQLLTHSIHKIHSVPFFRLLELSVTSTSIGQTFLHLPHDTHLLLSHLILNNAKQLIGFKKIVIGQIYLQKARLSWKAIARAIPTMQQSTFPTMNAQNMISSIFATSAINKAATKTRATRKTMYLIHPIFRLL